MDKEKRRESHKKYRESEKGKAVQRRYVKSEKGKAFRSKYDRKRRERNPEKYKAKDTLNQAIRYGRIVRPPNCAAHHWDYDYPLNVRWLTRRMHDRLHAWCKQFKAHYEAL